jgi:glutathione peroxidase
MRKFSLVLILVAAVISMAATTKSIYNFTLRSIDGQSVPLRSYHGKVLLVVNVASRCRP